MRQETTLESRDTLSLTLSSKHKIFSKCRHFSGKCCTDTKNSALVFLNTRQETDKQWSTFSHSEQSLSMLK